MLNFLKLPERDKLASLDDPNNIHILNKIIRRKLFLRKAYIRFYKEILNRISHFDDSDLVVELGSGASFFKEYYPKVITSDILPYDDIDMVFSALNMPFQNSSLSGIVMVDVLHHIKDSRAFFKEAERCLKSSGKIVMIEPANTLWSRFIYKNFHHEPFHPYGRWGFDEGGPLSGANMAIPWIIFYRDRQIFNLEFPNLSIRELKIHTPFLYLISGGFSVKQLLPSSFYLLVKIIELLASPFNSYLGMFLTIEIEKKT
jgi:SAM-dependent methyltransferase